MVPRVVALSVDYRKIDDLTFELEFAQVDCNALNDVFSQIVPEHEYSAQFPEFADMLDDPLYVPTATFGPFNDPRLEAGAQVSLAANPAYTENSVGYVVPEAWFSLNVEDTTIAQETLRSR